MLFSSFCSIAGIALIHHSFMLAHNVSPLALPESQQAVIDAFNEGEFADVHNLVNHFLKTLNIHHSTYLQYKEYSPYMALLVQSSGYGKTHLIAETACSFFVIYMCFRQGDSTGYPRNTAH